MYRCYHFLLDFYLCISPFGAIVNVISFISALSCPLTVYTNMIVWGVLALYPATLPNSLIRYGRFIFFTFPGVFCLSVNTAFYSFLFRLCAPSFFHLLSHQPEDLSAVLSALSKSLCFPFTQSHDWVFIDMIVLFSSLDCKYCGLSWFIYPGLFLIISWFIFEYRVSHELPK